ncbi:GtrA family protein [Sphingomonas aracearum]|uniref:GtrA family protein n=1 Tax=Sphingomonas aracearum TaxID=2283317 RepID=UPI001EEFC7FF|nr:GtrA family protein [Sphingomonas aracearum]
MTASRLHRLRDNEVFWQLVRFGIAGGLSTVIYSAVYLPLAWWVFGERLSVLAVAPAFVVAAAVGFVLHSRWSFKGYGTRDTSGRQQAKFLAVQLSGMALNLAFTWIITGPLFHGPAWAPLVPCIFVTPLATFALNRQLVFK